MRSKPGFLAMLAMTVGIGPWPGADRIWAADAVTIHSGVVYAVHDGVRLLGDLYFPSGRHTVPVIVAMHGGGWRGGGRSFYRYWGPFLARHGYALFTVEYRLGPPGVYPAAIYDVKAAIQFVRGKARELDVDPGRIALMGDSAGGYLAAMLALAGDRFAAAYQNDANAAVPADVKAVIGFYGIYDMPAQWRQDMKVTPGDSITGDFLGTLPWRNRQLYAEASPINCVTPRREGLSFLLIHGDSDNLVDPVTQSGAFNAVLRQAGFASRLVMVPGAAHYWASDPFEKDPHSFGAMVAPQILQFLDSAL